MVPPFCEKQEQAEVNDCVAVNSAKKLGNATPVGEAKKDEQKGVASGLKRRSARNSLSSKQGVPVGTQLVIVSKTVETTTLVKMLLTVESDMAVAVVVLSTVIGVVIKVVICTVVGMRVGCVVVSVVGRSTVVGMRVVKESVTVVLNHLSIRKMHRLSIVWPH